MKNFEIQQFNAGKLPEDKLALRFTLTGKGDDGNNFDMVGVEGKLIKNGNISLPDTTFASSFVAGVMSDSLIVPVDSLDPSLEIALAVEGVAEEIRLKIGDLINEHLPEEKIDTSEQEFSKIKCVSDFITEIRRLEKGILALRQGIQLKQKIMDLVLLLESLQEKKNQIDQMHNTTKGYDIFDQYACKIGPDFTVEIEGCETLIREIISKFDAESLDKLKTEYESRQNELRNAEAQKDELVSSIAILADKLKEVGGENIGLGERAANMERQLALINSEKRTALNGNVFSEEDYVDFEKIKILTPEIARKLSNWKGGALFLDTVEDLSPEAGRYLFQFQGDIYLNGLRKIVPEALEYFYLFSGKLYLNGLDDLDPKSAYFLFNNENCYTIELNEIETLSPETAHQMSAHQRSVSLLGLKKVDKNLAAQFCSKGRSLSIIFSKGVKIFDDAFKYLKQVKYYKIEEAFYVTRKAKIRKIEREKEMEKERKKKIEEARGRDRERAKEKAREREKIRTEMRAEMEKYPELESCFEKIDYRWLFNEKIIKIKIFKNKKMILINTVSIIFYFCDGKKEIFKWKGISFSALKKELNHFTSKVFRGRHS